MRFFGGLLAAALVVFLVVNLLNKPAYYVCSGTKTLPGQPSQPIQPVGVEILVRPTIDRLLFQSKNAGILVLEQTAVLDVQDDSGGILLLASGGDYRGQFARISRHLEVSTSYQNIRGAEYDLYCNETKLAPI